jgi:outer membrane protein
VNNVTPQTLDVNITQPLYRGGRTVAQTAEAEKTVEAERARLFVTEQQIFYNVIQAYLDVVRDQATLELSINNEQLLRKQLESTSEQFRVGTLTRTDVAQAESQLAGAVADRNQAEGNLQVSRANYERAVGHLPPKLTPTALRPVLPSTREQALELAANKNPNVIAALFAEDAARDQVKVIRGQLLPTVSLVGDYQRLNDTAFQHSDMTNASILARMTMPLYEGGAIYSQTRQAEQTVGQMKGQTDDARRAAVQGATQAWETMVSDRARAQALQQNVKAAEVAFEGTQAEQRVGTRTVLDVLITEQTLFSARVNLVSTQHDVALAEFNLSLQIGRLSAADLSLKIPLYDVNHHYHEVRDKWVGFGSGE